MRLHISLTCYVAARNSGSRIQLAADRLSLSCCTAGVEVLLLRLPALTHWISQSWVTQLGPSESDRTGRKSTFREWLSMIAYDC